MNAYITASELMKIAPRGYTLEKLAIKNPADLGNRQGQGVNKKPIGRVYVVPYLF